MRKLCCAFAALSAIPVLARAEEPLALGEILVSGGQRPIAADAYGRASSVVTAEDIERRQIRDAAEALRALPGVAVNRSGGPGGLTQIRLRGAEGNHVLVLIDGVEVSAAQTGEYDFAGLLAADIERIEVLRGPQSALYGSNAAAGVISIVTRRGPRGGFAAGGAAEGGSGAAGLASAYLRGGNDRFDLSLSGAYRRDGGFDVSDSPGGEDDADRNLTLNARASVTPFDDLSLGASFRLVDRDSESDQFNFGAAERAGLVSDADNSLRQREVFASLHGRLDSFGGRVRHGARLNYTDVRSKNLTNAAPSADVASSRLKAAYQASVAIDAPTLDAARHSLALAVEWERERFENVDPALVFNPSQLARQTRALFGVAGEYRGRFLDDLDVQIGLRYDLNDDFQDAFTYSAGASYLLEATGTRFHGSFGKGVTNPTFFEQFGFIPAAFAGNPDLEPEANFSWDLGVEQSFWDDRATIDVTYFQERLKNEIETLFPAPAFIATPVNLAGTSRRQGVEVAGSVAVTDGLSLSAAYTWLNAATADGGIEARRPRHEGRVSASYAFMGGDAEVTASARVVIGNYDTDFTAPAFGASRVRLDDYAVIDIAAAYRLNETVRITARIENLADAAYQEVDGYTARGVTGFVGLSVAY